MNHFEREFKPWLYTSVLLVTTDPETHMNLIVRDNIGNEFEGRGGVSMPAEVAKQLRDALNEAYPVEPQQLKPYYMVDEDRVVRVTSAHERVVHHDTVAYAAGSADPHFIADALNKAAA